MERILPARILRHDSLFLGQRSKLNDLFAKASTLLRDLFNYLNRY